ncbi:MAG: hypothetical protein RLZZ630_1663 [Bacteroidota bacterium]
METPKNTPRFKVIGQPDSILENGMLCHHHEGRILPPFIDPDSIRQLQEGWDTDENDIIICTHQKVGTHLTKKFVVEILRRAFSYNEEHGMATGDIGHGTVPWPEVMVAQHGIDDFDQFRERTKGEPRVWYTHCEPEDLPFRSIHPGTKFIFVYRDPKGAAVSQYFFYKSHPLLQFPQDMGIDTFVDHFLEGGLYFGDYHRHTAEWIANCGGRIRPESLLVLRYEDLVEKKIDSARTINRFISPEVILDENALNEVAESTAFDTMKESITKNPGTFHFNPNTFFRAGKTNDWEEKLSAESIEKIDAKTAEYWKTITGKTIALRA